MIDAAVYQHIAEDTSVTALVGTRIYRDTEEPNEPARPFIIFSRDGTEPERHLNGETGLFMSSFDIQVIASNASTARTLATLLRTRFSEFQGLMGNSAQQRVHRSYLEDDRSGSQKAKDGGTDVYSTVALSFNIWYEE